MSSETNEVAATTAKSSFPFFSILALIFITLKLTHVITWSWWLVLAPLWGPIAVLLGIVVAVLVIAGLCWVVAKVALH